GPTPPWEWRLPWRPAPTRGVGAAAPAWSDSWRSCPPARRAGRSRPGFPPAPPPACARPPCAPHRASPARGRAPRGPHRSPLPPDPSPVAPTTLQVPGAPLLLLAILYRG